MTTRPGGRQTVVSFFSVVWAGGRQTGVPLSRVLWAGGRQTGVPLSRVVWADGGFLFLGSCRPVGQHRERLLRQPWTRVGVLVQKVERTPRPLLLPRGPLTL